MEKTIIDKHRAGEDVSYINVKFKDENTLTVKISHWSGDFIGELKKEKD